jgi:PAS domain S-box-containing protein
MNPCLRVLTVEDSEDDCLLLIRQLRAGGCEPIFQRVETAEAMKAALNEQQWDIVISDYSMPHFSGLDALRLLQETGLDLPFLVVSGTIGEDVAVEVMKAGANDYLMKGNLKRLCPAIEREVREAQVRRERNRAEEAIRDSEVRYRGIMEQSADGIFLIDVETRRIMEANPAFHRILGYSAEEIKELSIYDFVMAERVDIDRRFQEILAGKGGIFFERQYRRKDGSSVDVWISGKLISYAGRAAVAILVRDLTEKKALEAQFLRAQRMESIGLLAGGIAHDLNNILSPILMNAELLQRGLSDPNQQRMLSSLISNAQRGADIVRQILSFSRGMEGERSAVSPRYLLEEMERFLHETLPKSIRMETEIAKDLWSISGDATQLHQVLMNLCLNARDAMPHGGTLSLSAQNVSLDETYAAMHPEARPGPYVLLSVSDTGCGIPPDLLEKIFDPFFTTKERGMGTGLGLSTALAIVKDHQGFLRIYSEVGKGTRFHVYLPASISPEKAEVHEEKLPLPSGQGELILVVEDEVSLREITQAALDAFGYRVLTASDGAEAVAVYAQYKDEIRVIITDMAMPIMDGPATIRALRKINPQVMVVATSGAEWQGQAAEATGLEVQAFLQKPFTAETLLRTVGEVLAERQA